MATILVLYISAKAENEKWIIEDIGNYPDI